MAIVQIQNESFDRFHIGKNIILPGVISALDTVNIKGNHARTLLRMEGFGQLTFISGRDAVKEIYKRYMRNAYGIIIA